MVEIDDHYCHERLVDLVDLAVMERPKFPASVERGMELDALSTGQDLRLDLTPGRW